MRVALYARVSKDDGQTPENQIDILRDLAARRGYDIAGEYVDRASGKDPNRPAWREVMDLARTHTIDAIMAVRVDRVMRSVVHLTDVLSKLEVYRVALIFSDMDYDPKTPAGQLMITIVSAIAQWERQIISARTVEGLNHRKAQGKVLGRKRRDDVPIREIALMRTDGTSWARISEITGIPKSTILGHRDDIATAVAAMTRTENTPPISDGSVKGGSF